MSIDCKYFVTPCGIAGQLPQWSVVGKTVLFSALRSTAGTNAERADSCWEVGTRTATSARKHKAPSLYFRDVSQFLARS